MLLEFNFEHYSDVLRNKLITHLHSTNINFKPISIGIQGDWGSGKTTLLEAIYHKVQFQQFKSFEEKKPIIIPVIFNAWRFEKEEHLIIPLLKQLYYQLLKTKESEGSSLNDKIEHLNQNIADKLLSLVTGFETEIDLKFFKLKYVPKDTIEDNEKRYLKRKREREHLETLQKYESIYFDITQKIQKLAEVNNVKFVFLIDDLDRCLPENSIRMLESIKLFLDIPHCATVLAIDKQIVELGIEHRYRDYAKENNRPITGSEYLEKIITHPFSLPVLCELSVSTFMDKYELEEEIKSIFISIIPFNPRKIIRVVELYQLNLLMFKNEDKSIAVAKAIIEVFIPELHREMKRDLKVESELNNLYVLAKANKGTIEDEKIENEVLMLIIEKNRYQRVSIKLMPLLEQLFVESK